MVNFIWKSTIFFTYFDHMEFCHLSQDSNNKIEMFHFHGKWNMEYKQSNGFRIGDSSKFLIYELNFSFNFRIYVDMMNHYINICNCKINL